MSMRVLAVSRDRRASCSPGKLEKRQYLPLTKRLRKRALLSHALPTAAKNFAYLSRGKLAFTTAKILGTTYQSYLGSSRFIAIPICLMTPLLHRIRSLELEEARRRLLSALIDLRGDERSSNFFRNV